MARGRVAAAILSLAVVGLVTVAVVGLVAGGVGKEAGEPTTREDPISVVTALSPRVAFFGDTVTAHVDVALDRTQLDPDLVRVEGAFGHWSRVGNPVTDRQEAGSTTYLRTTFVLRCLTAVCVPTEGPSRFEFKPARVSYQAPVGDDAERRVIDARWPALVVHSRLDAAGLSERDPLAAPWRADLVSLPAVTYRIRPGLLTWLLLCGGVILLAGAAALAYRALPHRREPEPEPEPEPGPALSPLEQALVLLETTSVRNGIADRRRALELIADVVAGWDEPQLAHRARGLAWSEETPAEEAMRSLAAAVREHVSDGSNGRPA